MLSIWQKQRIMHQAKRNLLSYSKIRILSLLAQFMFAISLMHCRFGPNEGWIASIKICCRIRLSILPHFRMHGKLTIFRILSNYFFLNNRLFSRVILLTSLIIMVYRCISVSRREKSHHSKNFGVFHWSILWRNVSYDKLLLNLYLFLPFAELSSLFLALHQSYNFAWSLRYTII